MRSIYTVEAARGYGDLLARGEVSVPRMLRKYGTLDPQSTLPNALCVFRWPLSTPRCKVADRVPCGWALK